MINIFLDAQIWLSLYSFSTNDLKQFGKLKDSIANGEVQIILTEQVINEVYRNRENKLHDVIDKTKNINFMIPVLYQGYTKEHSLIKKLLKEIQDTNTIIQGKINDDIIEQKLPQDILISELFNMSKVLPTNQKIIDKAYTRFMIIGNPPGKDNKCGDAINWETLLAQFDDGDLFFISDDNDYKSVLNKSRIKKFLENEWVDKKSTNIYFYENLNNFFNDHIKEIKLKESKKKDDLILELRNCSSFSNAHKIIAKMTKITDWDDNYISSICNIALNNDQILNIIFDNDIKEFFQKLIGPLLFETDDENIIKVQQLLIPLN